jgi:colanic acid/amylovoran biosynthesis glycosyltransferase
MKPREQSDERLVIIQSSSIWLRQTMSWLYIQTRFLPPLVDNHIMCDITENLDQFSVPQIHSLTKTYALMRWLSTQSWRFQVSRKARMFDGIVRRYSPEIMHSHFGDRGWIDMQLASRAGLKHVVTFYGYDVNRLPQTEPLWRERYLEMFEHADLILCEGEHLARCLARLGCPGHKIAVQRLGIMLDSIPFVPRSWRPGEPLRVLIASTFVEKKGIPYALQALARVKQTIELEITIIGDEYEHERSRIEKQKILDTIRQCDLQDQTRMMGFQPYSVLIREAYKNHIFLSPSVTASDGDTEGGAPVSIIEMSASGMQVVSTRHCDIPGVIKDGETGLLADERDVDSLTACLRWLIDRPERWKALATAGRRHIESEFDALTQGRKLAERYHELVAGPIPNCVLDAQQSFQPHSIMED